MMSVIVQFQNEIGSSPPRSPTSPQSELAFIVYRGRDFREPAFGAGLFVEKKKGKVCVCQRPDFETHVEIPSHDLTDWVVLDAGTTGVVLRAMYQGARMLQSNIHALCILQKQGGDPLLMAGGSPQYSNKCTLPTDPKARGHSQSILAGACSAIIRRQTSGPPAKATRHCI